MKINLFDLLDVINRKINRIYFHLSWALAITLNILNGAEKSTKTLNVEVSIPITFVN